MLACGRKAGETVFFQTVSYDSAAGDVVQCHHVRQDDLEPDTEARCHSDGEL